MSDKGKRFLAAIGFTEPTVGHEDDSTDALRQMVQKIQAEPDAALTCYNVDGEAMAVMIHPRVWDRMIDHGIVIPTDVETPWTR